MIRWLRDVTQQELQQGYLQALAEAQRYAASCWLVDARRRVLADESMVHWLASSYLPTLTQRLPSPIQLACLVAATWQFNSMPAPPLAELAQRPQLHEGYQLSLFGDEGKAMQWLDFNRTATS
ncbi:hypothetical protein DNI29_16145 [Hymenobacter sediminis]|uniref:hypothetical protein n=1 Tax=Hymenobacter sediminis TaxID=2218621 RepID=UPI000DA69292|nr:hypothetical protein [Hymenobacter sediminis]RPD45688.1 hypothetical protein DNI29_16145 [Hymenobacter sediminis]